MSRFFVQEARCHVQATTLEGAISGSYSRIYDIIFLLNFSCESGQGQSILQSMPQDPQEAHPLPAARDAKTLLYSGRGEDFLDVFVVITTRSLHL